MCTHLTYASSNSRTEQAYSLLMNKFMFTVWKTSLKGHHQLPFIELLSLYQDDTILDGYLSAKWISEMLWLLNKEPNANLWPKVQICDQKWCFPYSPLYKLVTNLTQKLRIHSLEKEMNNAYSSAKLCLEVFTFTLRSQPFVSWLFILWTLCYKIIKPFLQRIFENKIYVGLFCIRT